MMASDERFNTYINRVLTHEGGYVNNARDPGGETQWGISKRSYPNINIKALTREAAIEIYRRDFWVKPKIAELPAPLAFQVFDAAVNSGTSRAVKWLQQALGIVPDGVWGPATDKALEWMEKQNGATAVALKYMSTRLSFYTDLATFATFGRGWVRRMSDNIFFLQEDMP
jgi:lysozyme family protein